MAEDHADVESEGLGSQAAAAANEKVAGGHQLRGFVLDEQWPRQQHQERQRQQRQEEGITRVRTAMAMALGAEHPLVRDVGGRLRVTPNRLLHDAARWRLEPDPAAAYGPAMITGGAGGGDGAAGASHIREAEIPAHIPICCIFTHEDGTEECRAVACETKIGRGLFLARQPSVRGHRN